MEHRVQTGSVNARRAVQQAYAYISLAQQEPRRESAAGALLPFGSMEKMLGKGLSACI